MKDRRWTLLTVLTVFVAGPAAAQFIPIRTIPIAQGDQLSLFPTDNLGLGGVSIALADSLLDPFRNPALGGRVHATSLFASPVLYLSSHNAGAGRTLPLAALGRAGSWFGGLALAAQQVDASRPLQSNVIIAPAAPPILPGPVPTGPGDRTHGNTYGFASLGRTWVERGLSVGGSVWWANLHAQDGADLLFPNSLRFSQTGSGADLRLGLAKDWPGSRSLEAAVMRRSLAVRHEAIYAGGFWDPGTQSFQQVARVDTGRDRVVTWGVHVDYQRPLGTAGWRIGWVATANRLTEPSLTSSEVVTIPEARGRGTALNLGVGVSRRNGSAVYGADLIYEPVWSRTWNVAAEPVVTTAGDTIPVGSRTVDNAYRFSNVILRLGAGHDIPLRDSNKTLSFQVGLAVHPISYRLEQQDHAAGDLTRTHTHWVEWSPTWGLSLRFPDFALRYQGRALNGLGRPTPLGLFFPPWVVIQGPVAMSSLNLTGVSTVTHQVSIALPLR